MINKIKYIESSNTNPYFNLAMEEELLYSVGDDECILYLWQNSNTVVIGKNQNAWKECRIEKLQEEGGTLARRTTGGGAVYHDLGNLNFTFLVSTKNYDLDRQMEVILRAVRILGIHAEKSGRNDVLVDGKKFSGNAFLDDKDKSCHHGTLMVQVDKDMLSRYLNVSEDKLKSKGVKSVRSRVANLTDYKPDLTIDELKEALIRAFEDVYQNKIEKLQISDLDQDSLNSRVEKIGSWDWIFGRKIAFTAQFYNRFSWGDFDLRIETDGGIIKNAKAYSDSMEPNIIGVIGESIESTKYEKKHVLDKLKSLSFENVEEEKIVRDICEYIEGQEF